jgi:hypothetical protein
MLEKLRHGVFLHVRHFQGIERRHAVQKEGVIIARLPYLSEGKATSGVDLWRGDRLWRANEND